MRPETTAVAKMLSQTRANLGQHWAHVGPHRLRFADSGLGRSCWPKLPNSGPTLGHSLPRRIVPEVGRMHLAEHWAEFGRSRPDLVTCGPTLADIVSISAQVRAKFGPKDGPWQLSSPQFVRIWAKLAPGLKLANIGPTSAGIAELVERGPDSARIGPDSAGSDRIRSECPRFGRVLALTWPRSEADFGAASLAEIGRVLAALANIGKTTSPARWPPSQKYDLKCQREVEMVRWAQTLSLGTQCASLCRLRVCTRCPRIHLNCERREVATKIGDSLRGELSANATLMPAERYNRIRHERCGRADSKNNEIIGDDLRPACGAYVGLDNRAPARAAGGQSDGRSVGHQAAGRSVNLMKQDDSKELGGAARICIIAPT